MTDAKMDVPRDAFFTPTKHMAALDAHADLIEHLGRPAYAKYLEGYLKEAKGSVPEYFPEPGWEYLTTGEVAAGYEIARLSYSPTYWISPDALTLIEENIRLLPEDARVHPYDLVTQKGFAYFDRPVETRDVHDKICTFKALAWAIMPTAIRAPLEGDSRLGRVPGLVVTLYSDILDPGADEVYAGIDEQDRRATASLIGRLQILNHTILPWAVDDEIAERKSFGLPVDFGIEKVAPLMGDQPIDANLTLMLSDGYEGQWLRSFFMVLGERLISRVRPTRHIRRRMERKKMPEWGDIRVVDLRRYTSAGSVEQREQSDDWWVDWTHRHRVKAHWRRCWVKVEGSDERVPVWRPVKSYVRGPDHLPVIERENVYRAVR